MRIQVKLWTTLVAFWCYVGVAQTMSVISPTLSEPLEVQSGTSVTFEWEAMGTPQGAIFTHTEDPNIGSHNGPDPSWTQHMNWNDMGDGTYQITLAITDHTWVWGGLQSFFGWQFSNVLNLTLISNVPLTSNSAVICPGSTTELSTEAGYDSYQWYLNGDPIAPHDTNLPWLLYKDQMEDGIYTVDVMNKNCTKVSDDYVWTTLSAGDLGVVKISSIFPNPTTGSCRLVVDSPDEVETIYVYNSVGLLMMQMNSYEENLDLSRFDSGLYFIKIYYTDDSNENVRVVKE